MANKTSMFKLGLFVLAGFLMLAATFIWIGSHTGVKGGYKYVTYFAESVQGLEKGSAVKYQGIEVGRVANITVAPDPQLIEVTLDVGIEQAVGQSVMAGIALKGITGQAYIELVPQDGASVSKSPKIDFPTPYPVIPSSPRGINQVLSSVGTTLDNLSRVDFAGLSQQASKLLAAAQTIMDSSEVKDTLASIKRTADNMEIFSLEMARISKQLEERNLVGQLSGAVDDGKAMMANLRKQVDAMQLGRLSASASQYVEDIGRTLAQLTENLTEISDKLTYVFAGLAALSERLARTPSDAIFSNPPKPLPEERRR